MIVVDWGTSSFRAYRLAADGRILDRRQAALGILAVPAGGFPAALLGQIGAWLPDEPGDIIMGGMIGSRQGWLEAPYVTCPAGAEEIAGATAELTWEGRRLRIAPGVSYIDADGVPDVMRGEEVQIVGILAELGQDPVTLCMPGTHSKWVEVAGGRILSFRTYMTGESFALYRNHSILGRLMPEAPDADDPAAFSAGLARSGAAGGLLSHLFGVRTQGLFDKVPASGLASYLSGLLIGHEIRAGLADAPAGPVHLIAEAKLAALYQGALAELGRAAVIHSPDAAVQGLRVVNAF